MTWSPDTTLNVIRANHNFNSPQTAITLRPIRSMLDIRRQAYACNLELHPISSRQLFGFSPASPGAMRLRLSIFIFHFLGSSTGGITLALPMKAIGLVTIMLEVVQTSHYLALWSHFEMWWGIWLEKSLTLDVTSASMEADGLDACLPQKQPGLGPLVALLEKLHHLTLPTAPKTKRHRSWNRMVTDQQQWQEVRGKKA